jgi:hypothetical protein
MNRRESEISIVGKQPRLLLSAGTGRNSGKTSFACRMIEQFKETAPVVAFKVSPHRHRLSPGGKIILNDENLYIAEETDPGTGKDSSRMLAAGAFRSFFIIAPDTELVRAWGILQGLAGFDKFYIGESGGLRNYLLPGLFIVICHPSEESRKPGRYKFKNLADAEITYDGKCFDFDINRIKMAENAWKIF